MSDGRARRLPLTAAAATALLCLSALAPSLDAAGLTAPQPLVNAYDLILDARFEEAERQLAHACPPAPAAACEVLGAVAGYWRILLDPDDRRRDAALMQRIDTSIATAEAWVEAEPQRGEAWFYLGGAYGTRVLLRGHRGQYLAAARDGKRIHDSLQRAIKLDPSIADAYFGLGLYHYYAAIAPRAARILSALLFLPGGNRAGGLKEMEQTRTGGMLLRGEADYQMHLIYLWYERRPPAAVRLIEGLKSRYPHNPIFYTRLASAHGDYMGNHTAALHAYRELLDAARAGKVASPAMSDVYARLGVARELGALCDTVNAIDQLRAVIAARPSSPHASLARAHYQLGVVFDRAGRRTEATTEYRRAIALTSDNDSSIREQSRAAIRRAIPRACR